MALNCFKDNHMILNPGNPGNLRNLRQKQRKSYKGSQ